MKTLTRVGIASLLMMVAGTVASGQVANTTKAEKVRAALDDVRLKQKAEAGDAAAMVQLGCREIEGGRTPEGMRWLTMAAEQKEPSAWFVLGCLHSDQRDDVKDDEIIAFDYIEKAAKAGHVRSMTLCGLALESGRVGKPDDTRAAAWYKQAAKQLDSLAMRQLAYMALDGRGGIKKEDRAAVAWFTAAAAEGDLPSLREIALMHLGGEHGFEKNEKEAARLLNVAMDAGDQESKLVLARMYRGGMPGVPENVERSTRFLRELSQDGYVTAMPQLGIAYLDGLGIAANPRLAIEWFEKSIEGGSTHGMCFYGMALKQGRGGIEKDEARAVQLFQMAAERGDIGGKVLLATCYRQGTGGLPKDFRKSFDLLTEADKAGHMFASSGLAIQYANGEGVTRNPVRAEACFKDSLKRRPGSANAAGNYAWFLLGEGRREEGLRQLHAAFEKVDADTTKELRVELWFYVLAFEPERRDEALSQLRMLIDESTKSDGWNLARVVSHAVKSAPKNPDAKWLPKLADVISGKADAQTLRGWGAWNQAARQATVGEPTE